MDMVPNRLITTFLGIFCGITFFTLSPVVLAWRHGISLGYGNGREVGFSYYNSGLFVNAKIYKFKKIDQTLIMTIDTAFGRWTTTAKQCKDLTTWALSLAARAYFVHPEEYNTVPYLLLSFGPSYISHKHYGTQMQGSNLSLQTTFGLGSEFLIKRKRFDFNLRLIHYCNAGVFRPNQGFDITLVASLGYLF